MVWIVTLACQSKIIKRSCEPWKMKSGSCEHSINRKILLFSLSPISFITLHVRSELIALFSNLKLENQFLSLYDRKNPNRGWIEMKRVCPSWFQIDKICWIFTKIFCFYDCLIGSPLYLDGINWLSKQNKWQKTNILLYHHR